MNHESPSSNAEQNANPEASQEVGRIGDIDEALSYLKEYIATQNSKSGDTANLAELIDQASASRSPEAIAELTNFVSGEIDKLGGGGVEENDQTKQKLTKLNEVKTAFENHQENQEHEALRRNLNQKVMSIGDLRKAREAAETENEKLAEEACKDAKEACDNQVPGALRFNNGREKLAKQFGMIGSKLLDVSYNKMLENDQGETIKALNNLMTAAIEKGDNSQAAYEEFAKSRDRILNSERGGNATAGDGGVTAKAEAA
jgi:hypothetical protein